MNKEMEQIAIKRLQMFEPQTEPYYLAYSGGKDSDCIKILAKLAGVKHEVYHNITSVDAPETMQYIKSQPDVILQRKYWDAEHKNPITMWNLIPKKKLPPTRIARYCCSELKEWGGKGRKVITGVRWAESVSRAKSTQVAKIMDKPSKVKQIAEEIGADVIETKKGGIVMADENTKSREMVEMCYRWSKTTINPIVDWSNSDVWEFLRYYGCDGNPLYHCGFHRIGCIGCPMASKDRYREFGLYPKYKQNYIKAFERMLEVMPNKTRWNTGEEVFRWWMEEDVNQIRFDDLQEEYDELMEEYL